MIRLLKKKFVRGKNIINGNICKANKTNLSYIELHKIIIKSNKFLVASY